MAQKNQPSISGFSIYQDTHGRDVYYDFITRNGYLILESNANQFNLYQKRLIIPLIVFALLLNYRIGSFYINIYLAALAALIVLVGLEFLFRFRFLRSLKVVPNFQPEKRSGYIEQLSNSAEKSDLIIRSLLYIALSILVLVFGYLSGFDNIEWIICIVVSVCAAVMGIINVLAVIKKK